VKGNVATTCVRETLCWKLRSLQSNQGWWGSQSDQQALEPTCLAILALRRRRTTDLELALRRVEKMQNRDGSWPAFVGDQPEGCWVTSLAVLTLMAVTGVSELVQLGVRWLIDAKGREASWFWRRRFQTVDKSARFDPAKYGWSWFPGTTSWVIPTAFCLIALRQFEARGVNETAAVVERIEMGRGMLLDRMCQGGGWNAGNGMAFGTPFSAYIDATAIELLALAGHENEPGVKNSLVWLANRLPGCPSRYSVAWGILALAAYRDVGLEVESALRRAMNELTALMKKATGVDDPCTVAICALAFDAIEGDNVFDVRS
jgi:hypothetical protein